MLFSARDLRLATAPQLRESLFDFTTRMRMEAAAAGLVLNSDGELTGLRDRNECADHAG